MGTRSTEEDVMAASPGTLAVDVHEVARRITECLDDFTTTLGFRPIAHLEWRDGLPLPVAVAEAVIEAVDASLVDVHTRAGSSSAIVSIECRADAVEVCIVDDGCGRADRRTAPMHLEDATGIEHGVDDYRGYGICQWWSIPLDLIADAR
jgi:hypothetical protein